MLRIFLIVACLSGLALGEDKAGMEMINIPVVHKHIESNDKLSDILRHCPLKPFGIESGRSTQAHETIHIINSFIRNEVIKGTGQNAFYCGEGAAAVLADPNIKIRHVSNFIPKTLRGYRYKLYFVDQLSYWDDTPTYILDEWSAYIAGAEVGVEDFLKGIPIENSDIVSGSLEFSIYSVSLCLATKELDPNYWEKDLRLKHSVKYFLIRSEKVFFKGREAYKSNAQDKLLESLRTDENLENFRMFILQEFDGIFLK